MLRYFILLFIVLLSNCKSVLAQCGVRYDSVLFPVTKYTDIQYGANYDNKNQLTNLLLDVYTPDPNLDTERKRPLIIFTHGGSFVGGDRQDQHIDSTAHYFASLGYVTANIEYRVEQTVFISPFVNFADPNNFYKAILRGAQDLKAAIRFFKKDVIQQANTYGIDTSKIYLYGSSAGAIISLHAVFLDDTAEMNNTYKTNIAALGGLEGNSGNAGFSSKGVKAIVGCSGAVGSTGWLNNNTDIAYLGFHNSIDLTVPYDIGCFITVACFIGQFYGSKQIYQKAHSLGMNCKLVTVNGYGHPVDEFDKTASYLMIRSETRKFLKRLVCPTVSGIMQREIVSLNIFPNPSNGLFYLDLPAELRYKSVAVSIYNALGQQVWYEQNSTNAILEMQTTLPKGNYFIRIVKDTNDKIYTASVVIN